MDFVQVFKNVSAFIDCCCGNSLLQEVSENLSFMIIIKVIFTFLSTYYTYTQTHRHTQKKEK